MTSYTLEQKKALLPNIDHLSVRVKDGQVAILDQRVLPHSEVWLPVESVESMWGYVKELAVRGAPLIGCAAGLALAVHAVNSWPADAEVVKQAEYLKTSRPTAVNLMYCCDRIAQVGANKPDFSPENICKIAYELIEEKCDAMSTYGAELVKEGENLLHHCNTGALATMGAGTALGVIRKIHVYVDETRPLLQGGRLTTYELEKEGIPHTLICDNMAAQLMKEGKIDRVFVGADRVAMNGDFANKIGTYSVAVLAKYHGISFHPVAPLSTLDFECESGKDIPIEQRNPLEVRGAFGTMWAPAGSCTYNPAFDVTPGDLVTSLVLDKGVFTHEQIRQGALKDLQHK